MKRTKAQKVAANLSPYQAAKALKQPFVVLRVDGRTADPPSGALRLEGPVPLHLAKKVAKLILEIARSKA